MSRPSSPAAPANAHAAQRPAGRRGDAVLRPRMTVGLLQTSAFAGLAGRGRLPGVWRPNLGRLSAGAALRVRLLLERLASRPAAARSPPCARRGGRESPACAARVRRRADGEPAAHGARAAAARGMAATAAAAGRPRPVAATLPGHDGGGAVWTVPAARRCPGAVVQPGPRFATLALRGPAGPVARANRRVAIGVALVPPRPEQPAGGLEGGDRPLQVGPRMGR